MTYRNPFDEENQTSGNKYGWEDRGVLIQAARYTQGEFGARLEVTGLADGEDTPHVKFYFGDGSVTASEDGETLILDANAKLGKHQPLAQFGAAVAKINARLASQLAQRASTIVGCKFHFREIEQVGKDGKVKMREYTRKDGTKGTAPNTIPLPQSIISTPKGAGADEAVEAQAKAAIREVLAANGGSVATAELNQKLAAHLNGIDAKTKTAILTVSADRKFLKRLPDDGINFDGLRVSL